MSPAMLKTGALRLKRKFHFCWENSSTLSGPIISTRCSWNQRTFQITFRFRGSQKILKDSVDITFSHIFSLLKELSVWGRRASFLWFLIRESARIWNTESTAANCYNVAITCLNTTNMLDPAISDICRSSMLGAIAHLSNSNTWLNFQWRHVMTD